MLLGFVREPIDLKENFGSEGIRFLLEGFGYLRRDGLVTLLSDNENVSLPWQHRMRGFVKFEEGLFSGMDRFVDIDDPCHDVENAYDFAQSATEGTTGLLPKFEKKALVERVFLRHQYPGCF